MTVRVQHFKNMRDMYAGSSEDLVGEFLNVSFARDHEFQTSASRDAYARLVYSVGAFCYGEDFTDSVRELMLHAKNYHITYERRVLNVEGDNVFLVSVAKHKPKPTEAQLRKSRRKSR